MLRTVRRYSRVLLALMYFSSLALAQTEFSADIFNEKDAGAANQAKIFFGKDKIRIEAPDKNGRGPGAFIVNFKTHTSLVLMAQQHMYMEMPQQSMEQKGMYSFFETGDVENACADWLKMKHNEGGSCHKVGHETVNGRETVKYEGTSSSGEANSIWLDPKLRFPVKWRGKDRGGELRNIQEGDQPASLFEPPSYYTKMDLGAMTQRAPK
ncbi:MAG TPA: hypothetical protein VI386_03945 [Candidatus Sulfotelmatobacter sp.]